MSSTDEARIRRIQTALGPALLGYFVNRIEPAEDAVVLLNEVLTVVWRRGAQVPSEPEAARMWIFGVARKVAQQHRRTRRRLTATEMKLREHLRVTAPATTTPERMAVREAVAALPAAQRELVRLIHWDGFSIAEAAQITRVSASTARSRYLLARRRLAAALGPDPDQADQTSSSRMLTSTTSPSSTPARS